MIGIYYQKNMLPDRFPIYIAIVALARYIILGSKELAPLDMLGIGVTLLVLTIAVFLVRLGHVKFPYEEDK
jgi:protein PsiE